MIPIKATIFQVQLLAGRDKGKQGKVVTIDRKHNRLYVKGMNTVSSQDMIG